MIRKIVDGAAIGIGIVGVIALAIVIAWAGDVFTVDKDGTLKFAVNDQGKITVGATESYVNLVIQNNSGAANNKVDITADVLTVEGIRLENVNVSADLTLSGAGGLDTGSEAANTWYYVWAITNNTGSSTNGLLSTSSTSPTMPSGYTKKRRVGAVRNDGSSNFLQFVQEGNRCNYLDGYVNNRVLSGGSPTTYTTVNASAFAPPTSIRIKLWTLAALNHNVAAVSFEVRLRKTGFSGSVAQAGLFIRSIVANQMMASNLAFDLDVNASQQFDYMWTNTASSGTNAYIDVLGYYDRI